MDTSPNLLLPYIMAAQAQKHVTHNEAIRALDALLQIAVADRDLAGPPDSPADGARYIVATSPTGGWSGKQGQIAAWQDGAWAFYPPREGWIAWISDEDMLVAWSGSAWVAAGGVDPAAGLQNLTMLGVNATADTTNRLSVASAATLLNHAGDGHQLKINKAAAGSTASLLFQTGFSGRAEIGTTGTDQFEFKVSGDGAAWYTPLQVLPSGCVAQTADGGANGQSQLKARASGSTTSQRASLAFYPTFGSYPADTAPRRCADIIAGFTSVWGTEYLALNVGLNGAANDGEQLGTEILRLNADRSVRAGRGQRAKSGYGGETLGADLCRERHDPDIGCARQGDCRATGECCSTHGRRGRAGLVSLAQRGRTADPVRDNENLARRRRTGLAGLYLDAA